ncbi:MAG: restriction endonuclease subunit S [Candidatus Omnitrophota bacterium]
MSIDFPQGWSEVELHNCVDVLDSQRVPVNSDERTKRQGKVPYYGATGQVGWIDDYLFDEELLLIGEDGAPFFDKTKPIAYIINGKSWVNNHAHVLRAISNITSNIYLKYFLDWFDFHDYVNGTTRLKLTQGSMNNIPVRLAPINEQRRILAKFEKLLDKVSASQKRLEKIPIILKRFRQSVLAAACSGRLTTDWRKHYQEKDSQCVDSDNNNDLPEGWTETVLGEIGKWCSGGTPSRRNTEYFGQGVPWVKSGDLLDGPIIRTDEQITELGLQSSSAKLMPTGTISMALYGATIGKLGIMTFPAATNQACANVISNEHIIKPKYLFYYLFSERQRFIERGQGGAQPNISQEIVRSHPISLPSIDEQEEIVHRVEALFALADQLEVRYNKAKSQVDKLTQSILAKAFRGELVPQDPADEPVGALLEKLRVSKESKPTVRMRG